MEKPKKLSLKSVKKLYHAVREYGVAKEPGEEDNEIEDEDEDMNFL